MDGTRVNYFLVPGTKPGQTKCGRIYVHQPKRPEVESAPVMEPEEEAAPADVQQPNKRKLLLSTDPEEEVRRKKRCGWSLCVVGELFVQG